MLKEYGFSKARRNFTSVFDDVQNSIPSLIKARKKSESDGIILSREDLAEMLECYTFKVEMQRDEDGSFSAWLSPIDDYAIGETEEECRHSAAKAAQEFAVDLLNEPMMFKASNTRPLIPYALRILLCDSLEDVEQLLFGSTIVPV